jgi:hypothetical protein
MKTSIIIGVFICILSFPAHSQDVFIYDRNGAKKYFEKTDSIVQIKFRDGACLKSQILQIIFYESSKSSSNRFIISIFE